MCRKEYDVVVIGAGLVGAAVAYGLARAGQRVALLDEDDATYRASRGNFGLVWVQGRGVGRPEYALWSRASSERWFALADALSEDCGLSPSYLRPGGVSVALSEDEQRRLYSRVNLLLLACQDLTAALPGTEVTLREAVEFLWRAGGAPHRASLPGDRR